MNLNHTNQRGPDLQPAMRSRGFARRLALVIGLAMLWPGFGTCLGADAPALKEYEVKSAFLYNFTKFVEWPVRGLSDTNAPFVIAVAGRSPCTAELEQIAKDHKVNGRSLVIKVVSTPGAAVGAQLLFVPAAENARMQDWLAAAHGAGVLTVGESAPFFKQGGMINFIVEEERVRFEINVAEADAAGLKVGAQLQKLAKTVRRKLVD